MRRKFRAPALTSKPYIWLPAQPCLIVAWQAFWSDMCHTVPAPYVSCLKGNKTNRMDIHVYLGLLDRRMGGSTTAICMRESQKSNLVALGSKRPEVMEQGPGLWLQPVAEGWPVWVCAERLKMLESGIPWWGQAAGTHLSGRADVQALVALVFFCFGSTGGPAYWTVLPRSGRSCPHRLLSSMLVISGDTDIFTSVLY